MVEQLSIAAFNRVQHTHVLSLTWEEKSLVGPLIAGPLSQALVLFLFRRGKGVGRVHTAFDKVLKHLEAHLAHRRKALCVLRQLRGIGRVLHRFAHRFHIERVGFADIGQTHKATRLFRGAINFNRDFHGFLDLPCNVAGPALWLCHKSPWIDSAGIKAMSQTAQDALKNWHKIASEGSSPEALQTILHPDAVFHSPVVHTPQRGRTIVTAYLSAAGETLGNDEFNYVREVVAGNTAVLEFETVMDGIHVNGIDFISFDEDGLITDFKVMVRPLKAINKVWEMMGAQLQKSQNA